MKPRDFVINKNIQYRNCVYTVIPVLDNQLLDLPYHTHRLKQSLSLYNVNDNTKKELISYNNDFIADSCLKSFYNNNTDKNNNNTDNNDLNGLLTICIGLKPDSSFSNYEYIESDSFFYPMNSDFLLNSNEKIHEKSVIVDLQLYDRKPNPLIKASNWPVERKDLECSRIKSASETLIYRQNHYHNDDERNIVVHENSEKILITEGK